jgi:hypothetical protein
MLFQHVAHLIGILPDFQLTYARRKWTAERTSWRTVIQLNLVRNVNTVLDILAREVSDPTSRNGIDDDDLEPAESHFSRTLSNNFPVQLAEKYDRLNLRLSPLRKLQKDLETCLGAASSEETTIGTNGVYDPSLGLTALAERRARNTQEFCINSRNGWKSALTRVLPPVNTMDYGSKAYGLASNPTGDSTAELIASCRGDMIALWSDPIVQDILSKVPTRIQESPGL